MESLIALIPATVVVAVVLFVLKEIFEAVRRYKAERRAIAAIKTLLAIECERNHWTLTSIRKILQSVQNMEEFEPQPHFFWHKSKYGDVSFRTKESYDANEHASVRPYPKTHIGLHPPH